MQLGRDVSPGELSERYHAVVYAFGTATDNRLGIPGEDLPGSHPATEFVAWYNGQSSYADHEYDLTARRVVVIGNGNVAIDVARMIVLAEDELAPTDTADHAIAHLGSPAPSSRSVREARPKRGLRPAALMSLLWPDEVLEFLGLRDLAEGLRSRPNVELWQAFGAAVLCGAVRPDAREPTMKAQSGSARLQPPVEPPHHD